MDACTLAPANLCEILLRLGETPRLYSPQWSEHILTEVRRTHIEKLNWPEKLADFWQQEVRQSFPEALVTGYEPLIAVCDINEKDKHVLAAAIKARAELIVTTNIRHFPLQDLDPWGIEVAHPANYLITLYSIDPGVVVSKIECYREQPWDYTTILFIQTRPNRSKFRPSRSGFARVYSEY